ncbi:DNA methyltransferase [Salimicrobium flavidum]|uniref:site-specific DNA-methyltransferase (cytosine-N(4)-specific) n=1 Tax=Salimicrobium flavidum TaxID=570947 RepID=A0A1N7J2C0_9BACI|nr:DNA methyltransferase [Salimicrobium flavidum]SIS43515.1 DNA methylase [Salimicrobium flavidum]
MDKVLTPEEVNIFPYEYIEKGSIYTFKPEVSREVTNYTHGMHNYPAKYIPQIPRWAFLYSDLKKGDVVLDPFNGSGTTSLEAKLQGFNSYATEINPLGRLLAKVKTTPMHFLNELNIEILISSIKHIFLQDDSYIKIDNSEEDINLHENWNFWFEEQNAIDLIRIKRIIRNLDTESVGFTIDNKELSDLKDFLIICYSSMVKKVSYFDEREIKVRKKKDKFDEGLPDTLDIFLKVVHKHLESMIEFSNHVKGTNTVSEIVPRDATEIELNDNYVDLIVTSPPYLNAIDYPMAHKYNLFFLDLVNPDDYSNHCRDYVGVTERVVTKSLYSQKRLLGYKVVDDIIEDLYSTGDTTDRNRAYIIWQYFDNMLRFLQESYRVLKPGKNLIIVIGDNNIRKRYIPTHEYIRELATSNRVGFELDTYFYHQLRNIKLKVNRNKTGGKIKYEMIMILKKPLN